MELLDTLNQFIEHHQLYMAIMAQRIAPFISMVLAEVFGVVWSHKVWGVSSGSKYPLVNVCMANWKIHHAMNGKTHKLSMAMFNSYVTNIQRDYMTMRGQ